MLDMIHIANCIGGHDLLLLLKAIKAIEAEQAKQGTSIITNDL